MKKTVIFLICVMIVSSFIPVITAQTNATNYGQNEKIKVHIAGSSHQYKFGSFIHIGKLWYCPYHNLKLVFDVNQDFSFTIDGAPQDISGERVSISMDGFFGIAPTLYSFLTSDTVLVYGICDSVTYE